MGKPLVTPANSQRVICKCQLWVCLSQYLVNKLTALTPDSELRLGNCDGILGWQEPTFVFWKSDCSVHEVPFTACFIVGLAAALSH